MYEDQYLYSRCLIYTFCKAPTDPHQPSISIYLAYLIIFHLLQSFLILFGSFGPIQSTSVLYSPFGPFCPLHFNSVQFGHIRSIRSYFVHSVHFGSIPSILSTSVLFNGLRSHLVHFGPIPSIQSTSVLFGPLSSY